MQVLLFVIGLSCLLIALLSKSIPILQQSCLGLVFLGYTLFIDSLCFLWEKTSLLRHSFRKTVALFLFSLGFWVFFSTINIKWKLWANAQMPTDALSFVFYWVYHGALFPAFFATRYWLSSREETLTSQSISPLWGILGLLCLVLSFVHVLFYPLFFIAPFLFFDWINAKENRPSLILQWKNGCFSLSIAVAIAGLFLGLLYECINFYYGPFWQYRFALGFGPTFFGMKASGYIGYLVFGFDLYASAIFLMSLVSDQKRFLF